MEHPPGAGSKAAEGARARPRFDARTKEETVYTFVLRIRRGRSVRQNKYAAVGKGGACGTAMDTIATVPFQPEHKNTARQNKTNTQSRTRACEKSSQLHTPGTRATV